MWIFFYCLYRVIVVYKCMALIKFFLYLFLILISPAMLLPVAIASLFSPSVLEPEDAVNNNLD